MTGERDARLRVLYSEIEHRCGSTNAEHPWWPCTKGCGDCCRRLGALPAVSEAEWAPMRTAIAALPPARQEEIAARAGALVSGVAPFTCPLLDTSDDTCSVYAARPAACRSYGYYAGGGDNYACGKVDAALSEHPDADVLWGNQIALDRQLDANFGEPVSLAAWLREYERCRA